MHGSTRKFKLGSIIFAFVRNFKLFLDVRYCGSKGSS